MSDSSTEDKFMSWLRAESVQRELHPLLERSFVPVQAASSNPNNGPVLRIMQWNVLAQALSTGDDNFVLCPGKALDWENRKLHLLEEILRYRPHILCLEEVDNFSFFQESLINFGYMGIFYPKPDSPCMWVENNTGPDGCAVLYSTKHLILSESNSIVLQEESGLDTNQVSVICKFQLKGDNSKKSVHEFCVAVTHLKAKKGFDEMRFQQGKHLLKYLDKYSTIPLFICGDFNAEPTEAVYDLFQKSKFGLVSVYTHLNKEGKEPPYTTWKIRGEFGGNKENCKTIDYIWHTKNGINVKSVLAFPSGEAIGENRLPSMTYPSDHLSLACDFQLV
ncbi:hypothetical protein ACJMK2_031865 [Sinanodonta woodiana]|uniref:Nocturnin n=1 Tax=Sinanodonta woodiana TaxID=1069815 RepID=A0ABD3X272_SINWO